MVDFNKMAEPPKGPESVKMPPWDDARAAEIKAMALDMAGDNKVIAAMVIATILCGMTPNNSFMFRVVTEIATIADQLAARGVHRDAPRPH